MRKERVESGKKTPPSVHFWVVGKDKKGHHSMQVSGEDIISRYICIFFLILSTSVMCAGCRTKRNAKRRQGSQSTSP